MSHSQFDDFLGEFDQLMDEIGIWAVYTRSDHRFPCTECTDLDNHDSAPDCGACFGTGFRVTLERWLIYGTDALRRSQPVEVPEVKPGLLEEPTFFVFSRAKDRPVRNDSFFIVEWNLERDDLASRGGQPTRLIHVARVDYIDRPIAGKMIYNVAHCTLVDEAARQFERALLTRPITISRF
jgi:hypothetical protein